jgi:hypothetical protein
MYPEIAANDAQREEWVCLFAIDEITGDDVHGTLFCPAYSGIFKAKSVSGVGYGIFQY